MNNSVAVLMPVYNSEKYLAEAIESILAQSFKNFKFYVINDGSTDSSESIIKKYSDNRIIYLKNEKNLGLIYTLNYGLSIIDADFLFRMDADDVAHPDRFENQLNYMFSNEKVWVCGSQIEYFGAAEGFSDYPILNDDIRSSLVFNNSFAHPSVVIRLSKFRENKILYPTEHLHLEDYALWLKVAKYDCLFANLSQPLLKYRIEGQNISIKNWNTKELRLKKLYSSVISDLSITLSEKVLDLHFELSLNTLRINNFYDVYKYSKLLIHQNKETKKYSEVAFKKNIDLKLNKLFYKIIENGILELIRYFILTKSISYRQVHYILGFYKKKTLNLFQS